MAAGIATVVGRPVVGPSGISSKNQALGYLALSDDYQAGGDAIDPLQLGLATIDNLYLFTPRAADGGAITTIFFPVVRTILPIRTADFGGNGGNILIQAFTATATEESGDLSDFVIPYIAYGT